MDPKDQQSDHDFGAALPLPSSPHTPKKDDDSQNQAAQLIRKKVQAAYAAEPNAKAEVKEVEQLGKNTKRSKHQQFIYELTNSGKSLAQIQEAWHEYYAGLPDEQKHAVWQEFYSVHAKASRYAAATSIMAPEQPLEYEEVEPNLPTLSDQPRLIPKSITRTLADMRDMALGNINQRKKLKPMQHLQSLLFGLGVGSLVILIVMFSFFNERFIAPFIQPSRNVTNTEIIATDAPAGNNPEILIPKINVQIPVVYDVNTINDNAVETALERGVVHYADTASPGQDGNVVIVGHSSNNIFNPGKYKFAFVLLSRLDTGDTFYLDKDGKRFTYEVYKKEIVKPNNVSVLQPNDKLATATLITCDPPGTSTNRLVVVGQQISPEIASNNTQNPSSQGKVAAQTAIIPGNSPSLWSRVVKWFKS